MVPAEKVFTVSTTDSVRQVMDLMLEHKIGAVVVIQHEAKKDDAEDTDTMLPMPAGIITKSDIMKAYHDRVDINESCKAIMGDKELVTCTPNDDRDKVARIIEKYHYHHVVVVDEEHAHFVGLVSSWDISAECARDDRAFPYLRNEKTGEIEIKAKEPPPPPPPAPYDPHKPTTIENHKHDEFTTYMDDLDLMGFQ